MKNTIDKKVKLNVNTIPQQSRRRTNWSIPPDDARTLSVRYSLSLKVNKGWLAKEFGSIPSKSLKLKLLSGCCIKNAHTTRLQIYMIVSPDQQKNKIIVLIVNDYIQEDKPTQDMIDTSRAKLVFTPDDILNLFQAYDGKILTKVAEKGTGIPLGLHQDGPPMITDVRMVHHQKIIDTTIN